MTDETINVWKPPILRGDIGIGDRIATQADIDWHQRQVVRMGRLMRLVQNAAEIVDQARNDPAP